MRELIVVGGGLAGSEAAWQAAIRGVKVLLYEMRPGVETGAHVTTYLSELVCSNSLGSVLRDRASGLLKLELKMLGSLLMECAQENTLPGGGALTVDRDGFASLVTEKISSHPNITIIRGECKQIPEGPAIIASGPLTSNSLAESIKKLTGRDNLFFFDAISPIVTAESINMEVAYRASRYQRGESVEGDYINCPFNEQQYSQFVHELVNAKRIKIKDFEVELEKGVNAGIYRFFEGCLPVEILAMRDEKALSYGPLRSVGLPMPETGRWPHAVLQLRQDNLAANLYNMVGFQTNLMFSEQERVFCMVPGLENAEFVRFGQMHRNTFIYSPECLLPGLQFKHRYDLFFCGQITGVEGYAGNIGTGLLAGINASRFLEGKPSLILLERPC